MRQMNRAAPALLAVLIAFACAPGAHAALELKYRVDAAPVTTLVTSPIGTSEFFSGNLGITPTFSFAVWAGTNKPGTPNLAMLFTTTLLITNLTSSAHTLELWVAETGFMAPGAPPAVRVHSGIGGTVTTGSSVNEINFRSCIDPTNSQEACAAGSTVVGPGTPSIIAPGVFSDDKTTLISSLGTPYSLSQHLTLKLGGGSTMNFSDTTNLTPTPEPASFLLVGGALFGTAAILKRRRRTHA
jgi:hypothetical protein